MEFKNLLFEKKDNIAIITINRPEKLNALNGETVTELSDAFQYIHSQNKIRAVIVTGAGEKAFVAGADIKEINNHDEKSGKEFSKKGTGVFRFIEKMSIPVIAAVNGFALGGGCELAMACHLRIASANAKFGQPEINLGIIPGYGGTQRLPRLIGKSNALYFLLTGDMIDANKAQELGLINEVVQPEELMTRAEEIARLLASKAPFATQNILQTVDEGMNKQIDEALNIEATYFGNVCGSNDMKEGTSAFLEKRKPVFKGN
jgi:enoyl-CoA hydratase